jgi:hypothetical protein
VLKSQYIPPLEKRRIDEFIKILTDEVEPSYQTTSNRVNGGFDEQTQNLFQLASKQITAGYTKQSLALLGVHIFGYARHVSTIHYIHLVFLIMADK